MTAKKKIKKVGIPDEVILRALRDRYLTIREVAAITGFRYDMVHRKLASMARLKILDHTPVPEGKRILPGMHYWVHEKYRIPISNEEGMIGVAASPEPPLPPAAAVIRQRQNVGPPDGTVKKEIAHLLEKRRVINRQLRRLGHND